MALVRREGLILPRLLIYGLLSTVLLAAYIAVVSVADLAFGSEGDRAGSLVAAGLIAVLVAPVRARLQRAVDRLVYGDRGDPYAALSDLGRRIAGSPDDLLRLDRSPRADRARVTRQRTASRRSTIRGICDNNSRPSISTDLGSRCHFIGVGSCHGWCQPPKSLVRCSAAAGPHVPGA